MDKVLAEASRLHKLGFAIHLLHKKSKRPINSGWTTGPRATWDQIINQYEPGMNIGVRLGTPSKIKNDFLAVIDIDVKSKHEKHIKEAAAAIGTMCGELNLPEVKSGRGNGSRHYYILTPSVVKPYKAMQSTETVKVSMPSVLPSKREQKLLTLKELESGIRLRPAWEVSIMGDGQQVVLPPSIHPDSGLEYKWSTPFAIDQARKFNADLLKKPEIVKSLLVKDDTMKPGPKTLDGFKIEPVELSWLPVPKKIKQMIITGEGVEDRSAMLLPVCQALVKAQLTRNEILTLLTNPKLYLGQTAYHHAKTRDRQKAAAWLNKFTLEKAFELAGAVSMFSKPLAPAKPLTAERMEEIQSAYDDEHNYLLDLDKTKHDILRPTLRNVITILENEVGECIVERDLFCMRDTYAVDTPWGNKKGDAICDEDAMNCKLWFGENFNFEPNNTVIEEAHYIMAKKNGFDPVLNWLNNLPAWDKTPRLGSWFNKNFGAKNTSPAAAEYHSQVFEKWITAIVARAFNPGMKFDWMPILEGFQGYGKSSFGSILCGDKYFLDSLPDLRDKDSCLALQGIWVVEFGELAGLRRNELETVKAFLVRTVDKVRPPFGRRWLEIARRCVFFGTTNKDQYLKDDTGNRRFKPVKVGRLNFKALREEREQLFAEAMWLFKNKYKVSRDFELTGIAVQYEKEIHGEKMIEDESDLMRESLVKFIEIDSTKEFDKMFDFSRFKISDLFHGDSPFADLSPPLKNWKFDSRNVQFAAKALKHLGGDNFKIGGIKYWKLAPKGIG